MTAPGKLTRILHVAPTPFFSDRGCHVRIKGEVGGLASFNIDSLVCTYPIGRDIASVRTVRCAQIPGYSKTEAGPSIFRFIADPLMVITVCRQIKAYDPDVLHCHLHEGLLIGWLARLLMRRRDLPLGFDMQGGLTGELESFGYLQQDWLRKAMLAVEKKLTSLAEVIFCSSPASARLLTDCFEVPASKITLASDGTDVSATLGSEGPELPQLPDTTIALYAGGLVESKGLSTLKEILTESAERSLDIHFLIVGYPVEDLKAYVRERDLGEYCTLVGQVPYEQLPWYLDRAHIALEPKPAGGGEASGKLLNYMAAGMPVACFGTANNRQLMDGHGYYAEGPGAAALVDQLQLLLADPDEARSRGRAGKAMVARSYSWKATAAAIVDKYQVLTAQRPQERIATN